MFILRINSCPSVLRQNPLLNHPLMAFAAFYNPLLAPLYYPALLGSRTYDLIKFRKKFHSSPSWAPIVKEEESFCPGGNASGFTIVDLASLRR